jgi:hypothetical protein
MKTSGTRIGSSGRRNRWAGEPKLKIKEMGSRYLFICLYVWLEKYFSRGDYKRSAESAPRPCWRLQMLQHPRSGPLICNPDILTTLY